MILKTKIDNAILNPERRRALKLGLLTQLPLLGITSRVVPEPHDPNWIVANASVTEETVRRCMPWVLQA